MKKSVGERTLNLSTGRSFTLRPDFSALESIEAMTGKTIMQLLGSFTNTALMSAKDIVYILYSCARSGDEKFAYTLKAFGEQIVYDGVYEFSELVVEMIDFVMTGGKKKVEEDLKAQSEQQAKLIGETSTTQQSDTAG